MFWRTEEQIVIDFVETFRRIFQYDKSWVNKDLSIVALPSGSSPFVYETYFEDNEHYPLIAVMGAGGTLTHQALNNLIQVVSDDGITLGTRSLSYVEVTAETPLSIQLPQNIFQNQILRGVSAGFAYSGLQPGGDNIELVLTQNFTSTGSVIAATGSIIGTDDISYQSHQGEFATPYPVLSGQDYWVTFNVPPGSSYFIGIDPAAASLYQYTDSFGNTQVATGSIFGDAILPAFIRMGTSYEGSIVLRCSGKNSSRVPRTLSSLIAVYTELLKRSQITREITGVDLTQLVLDDPGILDEWLSKGIRIKAVKVSGVGSNIRPRGDNDRIFSSDVTVDIYAEWFEDYPLSTLKQINVTIGTIGILNSPPDTIYVPDDSS